MFIVKFSIHLSCKKNRVIAVSFHNCWLVLLKLKSNGWLKWFFGAAFLGLVSFKRFHLIHEQKSTQFNYSVMSQGLL